MPNGSYSDGITTQLGAVQQPPQLVVGHEPGEVHDVADALHVDLRLQLGEVGAAAGDHAADVGHAVAQVADRPGQHLEALLVLDAAPRDDQRLALVAATAAPAAAHWPVSTPLGTRCTFSERQLEAVDDLADHEPRAGDDLVRLVREPPLDGVDRGRRALAARSRRGGPARWRGSWRPAARPTASSACRPTQATSQSWAWTTCGRQSPSRAASCVELVVGRRHPGDEVVVGQPRQVGVGPQHAHALDHRRRRRRSGGARLNTTTSWPARAIARARPSTWAAMPPTTSGGYSHDSIRTRIDR